MDKVDLLNQIAIIYCKIKNGWNGC
jgi:hypothetical protein